MSMASDLTERCSTAGAQALRLAADPADTLRAAALLLRSCPSLAVWLAGWAFTELPLHVLAGHALSAVNAPVVNGLTNGLAAQRADRVLREALVEAHGDDYADHVHHPESDEVTPRRSIAGLWHATQHNRRYAVATDVSYGPAGRDHRLDIWRRPGTDTCGRDRKSVV